MNRVNNSQSPQTAAPYIKDTRIKSVTLKSSTFIRVPGEPDRGI